MYKDLRSVYHSLSLTLRCLFGFQLRHQIPETILNFPKESSGSALSDEAVRNQDLRQQSLRQDEVEMLNLIL